MDEADLSPEMLEALDELREHLNAIGCSCAKPWPYVRMDPETFDATHQHGHGCPLYDNDNRFGALN